ncbi:MAG: glycoside hydrolase family 20 zincin-like fold domain-containing protein [Gemmatimonadota bacterium]
MTTRLRCSLVLLALSGAATLHAQAGLIPEPRQYESRPVISLAGGLSIAPAANPDDRFAAADLVDALKQRGIRATAGRGPVISLIRTGTAGANRFVAATAFFADTTHRAEGYWLSASGSQVTIVASTSAGIFYGVQTLKQLIEGNGSAARLRGAVIADWPAMRWRGFHDDLSRGPVPTLEFQKKQLRTFAAYKLNVYSPYFEHTLAYASDPLIAPPNGAMTREDVRTLVEYAKRYHIEVIPEQEAFGHLHHVLKHESYAGLGETPHGHVLAPGDPATLPLIRRWFFEIDSLFPGRFIHIGADETDELGTGRTRAQVDSEGIGQVYLGFLKQIADTLRPLHRTLLFWGDVAMKHPELVGELPRNMIAVGWDYWSHDNFDRYLKPFRDVGMETWVAPGVGNWNRVWPEFGVALPNIQGFIRDGQRGGSTGVLNTSWDDDGEAIFNEIWYGVLFGAAASWQAGESDIADFQRNYGRIFHGDTTGQIDQAQLRLIDTHAMLEKADLGSASNGLFWLDPWSDRGRGVTEAMMPVVRDIRLNAEDALRLVARARAQGHLRETDALDALELGARRIDLLAMKYQFAEEIARMYAEARDSVGTDYAGNKLLEISQVNGRMQDIRDGFMLTRELYQAAWLRENRPYWIENVLTRYDIELQRWITRGDQVWEARRMMGRKKYLPENSEIGIPKPVGQ